MQMEPEQPERQQWSELQRALPTEPEYRRAAARDEDYIREAPFSFDAGEFRPAPELTEAEQHEAEQQARERLWRDLAAVVDFEHLERIPSLAGTRAWGTAQPIASAVAWQVAGFVVRYYGSYSYEEQLAIGVAIVQALVRASVAPAAASAEPSMAGIGASALRLDMRDPRQGAGVEPVVQLVLSGATMPAGDGNETGAPPADRAKDETARPACAVVIFGCPRQLVNADGSITLEQLADFARQWARDESRSTMAPEIVVLVDPALGGGIWVDIDPSTGRVVTAFRLALPPSGADLLPLGGITAAKLRVLPTGPTD
jgi:hypothetical protein